MKHNNVRARINLLACQTLEQIRLITHNTHINILTWRQGPAVIQTYGVYHYIQPPGKAVQLRAPDG